MTASLLLLWLNQYTIPYGVAIGPLRDRNFNTKPNLPVFEIIQQEATDIGIVVVEIPDPLPLGRLRTKISVRSHRYSQESELKKHFPGIKKLQKVLLINPEGRENDPI